MPDKVSVIPIHAASVPNILHRLSINVLTKKVLTVILLALQTCFIPAVRSIPKFNAESEDVAVSFWVI